MVYINHELNSLSFVGLQGYVLYGYTSARCLYLVDRSWYIVHIVGKILFSMLRTLQIPPPLQTRRTPCWEEFGKISVSPRASVISIPELFTYALYIVIAFVLEVIYILLSLCCLYCLA